MSTANGKQDCECAGSHTGVSRGGSHVGFRPSGKEKEEFTKEREKYLTARYPKNQMSLIRKRLGVEDWIDVELKRIYDLVNILLSSKVF